MICVLVIAAMIWCIAGLLLAIFRWDWLSQHPLLYLDRLGRWSGAEYDPNIRKRTIIKFSICLALGCVGAVLMLNNYRDVQKLADYTQVNAGETLPQRIRPLLFPMRISRCLVFPLTLHRDINLKVPGWQTTRRTGMGIWCSRRVKTRSFIFGRCLIRTDRHSLTLM